jgi:hypothetical protein
MRLARNTHRLRTSNSSGQFFFKLSWGLPELAFTDSAAYAQGDWGGFKLRRGLRRLMLAERPTTQWA